MPTTTVDGRWTPGCSGGVPPASTWAENPQYGYEPSFATTASIELIQHGAFVPAALWILEADRADEATPKYKFTGFIGKAHSASDRCSLTVSLPGRAVVIFVATSTPNQHGRFSLSVSSDDASARLRALSTASSTYAASDGYLSSYTTNDGYVPPPPPRGYIPDEPPPRGWRTAFDKSGSLYYYHETTRRAQYERPTSHGGDPAALIGGWRIARDDRGKEYFWNEHTYDTSRDLPRTVAATNEDSRFEYDPPLPLGHDEPPLQRRGALPPAEVRERIAEVEKEALRLRSELMEAQTDWEHGLMRKLRSRPSVPPRMPANAAHLPPTVLRARNREEQDKWARRQRLGRASSARMLQQQAADRLGALADAALLECGYGDEVRRIKAEKRKPRAKLPTTALTGHGAQSPPRRSSSSAATRPYSARTTDAGARPTSDEAHEPTTRTQVDDFLQATTRAALLGTSAVHEREILSHVRTLGGVRGSRLGQFHHPAFVTMLSAGDVCVADTKNERLQILAAADAADAASAASAASATLTSTKMVKRVLSERRIAGKSLGERAERLRLGGGVACDRAAGLLYAIDSGGGGRGAACVRKLKLGTADGELVVSSSAEVELSAPEGLALSPDGQLLCVTDSGRHVVVIFEALSLRYVRSLGGLGSARGQLRAPDGVAIHDGKLYVADTYNHRVSVFWLDGGAAVVRDKMLRAAVAPNGCERTIGRLGSDRGLFEFPRGISVVHEHLVVAEPQRVQLLTLSGEPVQVLSVPGAAAMRGLCSDGWRVYVADYEAHAIHVLNVDALKPPPPAAPPRTISWTKRTESLDDPLEAARRRILAFMEEHDVHFNGAGEAALPSVEQAWSIDHLDPAVRRANRDTIRGIAAILQEYPTLECEVHGETGAARSAPEPLARHFGLHPADECELIMEKLALLRARACLDALVSEGVPSSQLHATSKGMGGHVRVDFIPRRATAGTASTAASQDDADFLWGQRGNAASFLQSVGGASQPPASHEARSVRGGAAMLSGAEGGSSAALVALASIAEGAVVGGLSEELPRSFADAELRPEDLGLPARTAAVSEFALGGHGGGSPASKSIRGPKPPPLTVTQSGSSISSVVPLGPSAAPPANTTAGAFMDFIGAS